MSGGGSSDRKKKKEGNREAQRHRRGGGEGRLEVLEGSRQCSGVVGRPVCADHAPSAWLLGLMVSTVSPAARGFKP